MLPYLFTIALVGLPAGFGANSIVRNAGKADFSTGAFLLVYAAILGFVFYKFMPSGRLTDATFHIQMPGIFLVSVVIGVIIGIFQRRKT